MDSLAAAYSSSVSRAFSSAYLLWRSSKQSAKPPQPTYRANTSCSSGVASRSSASSLFSRRMARTLLLNRSPGVPTPRASSVMWYSCRSALGTSGRRTKGETLALRWGWGGARVGSLPPWSCPSAELSAPFSAVPTVFSLSAGFKTLSALGRWEYNAFSASSKVSKPPAITLENPLCTS